jgi:ABC-type uncharacterized transport system auxiliary subunit
MNMRIALIGAFLPALLLQACSGILTSEQAAKQYYLLVPLTGPGSGAAAGRQPLDVAVTAVPGLDTDRILALGADARLNRYSNARWPDHLPEVLTSVLRRSLEAAGGYDTRATMGQSGDGWRLHLEARQFYGKQDTAGATRSVVVELAGWLECSNQNYPVNLNASGAVSEQRLSVVVAAHQAGLDSATRDLLEQVTENCGK